MHKDFDSLTITDDFIFCHIMQDKTICSSLLRMLLPDVLAEITAISYQKSFDQLLYAKGIRLDVWAADTAGKLYDIEMQTANAYNLAKRLRYYQAVLDISTLEKGTDYEQLHDSFLIFFCTFDYLAKGLPVYTFKTVCSEDMRIRLPDAMTKVIVNSSAAEKERNKDLRAFLKYMNGDKPDSPFVYTIDEAVKRIKADEQHRREYMMLRSFEMDARRVGFQQGITQGMRQGKSLGLAEGSRQKALETARLMKQASCEITFIENMTGLSKEEVEKL